MVWIHWRVLTKASHIAIAQGIAAQHIVQTAQGVGIVVFLRGLGGKEQRHARGTEPLGQTAPAKVLGHIAYWSLEIGGLHLSRQALGILADHWREHVAHLGVRRSEPGEDAKSGYLSPNWCVECFGRMVLGIIQPGLVAKEQVELGGGPEPLVGGIAVAILARRHLGFEFPVHQHLPVENGGVLLRPFVSTDSGLSSQSGEFGIVGIALEETRGLCHHSGEIEGSGHRFGHHIALLVAVLGHHETLEVGIGEFVVHTAVVGVLHREHPMQVVVHLVEEVGCAVPVLRDVEL